MLSLAMIFRRRRGPGRINQAISRVAFFGSASTRAVAEPIISRIMPWDGRREHFEIEP